ncbi:MAG TPA: chemotaxis protein CheW [Candidatus Binatia bacterium]|nr:chemotaxis protein CheW [Candidatus Binatia bacterium]
MSDEGAFALDDELLQGFISESREHLADIEADLLAIEQAGEAADAELVNKVFRAAHSIKGCSGFLGLNKVKELAHKAETVLDMLRSHKIKPNAEVTNILLAAFDKLREMVNSPATSEEADTALELRGLVALAESYLPPSEKPTITTSLPVETVGGSPMALSQADFERAQRSGCCVYALEYDLIHDVERQGKSLLQLFHELDSAGEILDVLFDFAAVGGLDAPIARRMPLAIVFATLALPAAIERLSGLPSAQIKILFDASGPEITPLPAAPQKIELPATCPMVPPAAAAAAPAPSTQPAPMEAPAPAPLPPPASAAPSESRPAAAAISSAPPAVEDTLRVNVGLLDTLMNLAGELVLSRNQFQAAIVQNNHRMLNSAGQRLSQVTSEIQDAIMRTRLQPIENVFGKLPRVVRDLSNSLGKEVKLDIRGKEVALDRSLVEGLSDPLTHMVRNAIDHGIEMPAQRRGAHKEAAGTLRVEARHEAGQVVIEIADDGKGIDTKRVAQAAVAKGLITAEQLKTMTQQDQLALILAPGLSTAEKVSEVSGRGVGMDVVKTNLDRLGGQLEISSTPGQGSLFRIKLPLTLTIIPALIVSAEGERFAIPQINVEELLRIRPEETKSRIEVVGGTEVLLLRDRILPLLRLDSFLGVLPTYNDGARGQRELDRRIQLADRRSPRYSAAGELEVDLEAPRPGPPLARASDGRRAGQRGVLEIAVITTGRFQYGLVVQTFHNTEEIVVKPLGHHLKESREYAGATILGDGAVALILDAAGLATRAELTSVSSTQRAKELEEKSHRESEGEQNQHSLLLFRNGPNEHCAVPLGAVRRIERIKPEQVEMAGGRRTMKYRDESLPLVTLSDTAQMPPISGTRDLAVIVSNIYGREVGLLGAMPVDVAEASSAIDSSTHRQKGIAGSSIICGHTTLIADLVELVDAVYPEWGTRAASQHSTTSGDASDKSTILLAEDSEFFRAQLRRFLEADGYDVLDAADGAIAWRLLEQNLEKVNLVVTDIEMPNMNGLDLTRHIRADNRIAKLPVIAVSSLASDEDMAQGRSAGVNDYQIKLDRDALMSRVHSLLAATPQNNVMAVATM